MTFDIWPYRDALPVVRTYPQAVTVVVRVRVRDKVIVIVIVIVTPDLSIGYG